MLTLLIISLPKITKELHRCIFNTLGAAAGFLMKKRSKFAESKSAFQPSDSDCHTLSPTIDFFTIHDYYKPFLAHNGLQLGAHFSDQKSKRITFVIKSISRIRVGTAHWAGPGQLRKLKNLVLYCVFALRDQLTDQPTDRQTNHC